VIEKVQLVELGDRFKSRHAPYTARVQSDSKGALMNCVVKPCRSKASAAASVSEWLAANALKGVVHRAPTPLWVKIGPEHYARICADYESSPDADTGPSNASFEHRAWHYATAWEEGTAGPLSLDTPGPIQWSEYVYLYVFDRWIQNIDRHVLGNTIMREFAGTLHPIPVDNSDCFKGSGMLAQGIAAIAASKEREVPTGVVHSPGGAVEPKPVPIEMILGKMSPSEGKIALEDALVRCAAALERMEAAAKVLYDGWAEPIELDAAGLIERQRGRLAGLRGIVGVDRLTDYPAGGRLIGDGP